MSLGELFSGEITPDEIWDYILNLPRHSATWAAVYADPETVIPDGDADLPEPRLTEFSAEVEAIKDVHDAVVSLIAVVSAFTSKTPVNLNPARRPGEARREQAKARRHERARAEWNELLRQMGIEG